MAAKKECLLNTNGNDSIISLKHKDRMEKINNLTTNNKTEINS